jgi:hypothetical protein
MVQSKNRRRIADGFSIVLWRLRFLVNINGKIILQEKLKENAHLCKDTLGKCAYRLMETFWPVPNK